ncbi:MAG: hypothetical protein FJ272_18230, partial [Planctomycetes bacterium]|nr:hypothetical protein [Planctomycetota bacterium]
MPAYSGTTELPFSDDFCRADSPAGLGQWAAVKGQWVVRSVKDENLERSITGAASLDPKRGLNFYWLRGRPAESDGFALTTTGGATWMNYTFAASVKSFGGAAGIAFDCRGPQEHLLLRLEPGAGLSGIGAARLIRVAPDSRRTLAEASVACRANQWYKPSVALMGQRVRVFLDEALLFDVVDEHVRGGGVGLFCEGKGGADFDDVKVQRRERYEPDRAVLNPKGLGPQISAFGQPNWQNYVLSARFRAEPDVKGVGVAFGCGNDGRSFLIRLGGSTGPYAGRVEMFRVEGAGMTKLVHAAGGFQPRQWHHLLLDLTEPKRA